jgi:hypothetical protein
MEAVKLSDSNLINVDVINASVAVLQTLQSSNSQNLPDPRFWG